MSHILVVEDEAIIRNAVRRLLTRHNHEVTEADSVDAAKALDLTSYDMIISDLRLPGGHGTDLIELAGKVPVLIMTSYASLRSAVDAMKLGAVDYIAKPFDHDEMIQAVERILAMRTETTDAVADPHDDLPEPVPSSKTGIIGSCEPMQLLFRKIAKVAPTDATVLIQGESGTGKELVAKAIHNQSRRADKPLISVNCAAIPETLIESELFGHEKGAFTGATAQRQGLVEAADGGTLFLDEIGELPLEAQARLLRVLQEGEIRRVGSVQSQKVNVRLVAATHRNLKELSSQGEFREDLYYRLNVMELHLPPLRDRGEDVIEIAVAMLARACEKMATAPMRFNDASLKAIRDYHWPGNVRELENAVERSVILAESDEVEPDLLGIEVSPDRYISDSMRNSLVEDNPYQPTDQNDEQQGDLSLDDYFVHFVLENEASMTETELAKKLGISRKSLWERRQRLGIPRKKGGR
ncbi:MAG: sigma-54 dependent transcriptional regulator [Thalassolituus sp.]|jgi:DNA-binding NtrC family response regulator|uniref:sigma-54-dependent transcriptional regulator n=1 Tax=unclassified Thalassolituus TaxID=2624967 RepID=UPI000C0DF030|nr:MULTISPECIES: sigma-54 dependent transcriptional regulator [unclassified Thalassolituus]MBN56787.1 response regulator [Oceanospirillaceae bacterium]MDQ4424250.1 sigma-54 dependent transcriptional regulator [Thalassolituus sp.]MDQ4424980.1 sigma-54 dependent transcriptional regulator [Thalassolituus sp.]|tara:strand:- start:20397 stop:21800 length:1404 start_codon:yes stop_codon:yes gene_type:complete